jgi:hypothetical protein
MLVKTKNSAERQWRGGFGKRKKPGDKVATAAAAAAA